MNWRYYKDNEDDLWRVNDERMEIMEMSYEYRVWDYWSIPNNLEYLMKTYDAVMLTEEEAFLEML